MKNKNLFSLGLFILSMFVCNTGYGYAYRASLFQRIGSQGNTCCLFVISDVHFKGTKEQPDASKKQAEVIVKCLGTKAHYILESFNKFDPLYKLSEKCEKKGVAESLPSVIKCLEEYKLPISGVDSRLSISLSEAGYLSINDTLKDLKSIINRWQTYNDNRILNDLYRYDSGTLKGIIDEIIESFNKYKRKNAHRYSEEYLENLSLQDIGLTDTLDGTCGGVINPKDIVEPLGVEVEAFHSLWLNKDKECTVICLGGAHCNVIEDLLRGNNLEYKEIAVIGIDEEAAEDIDVIPAITTEDLANFLVVERYMRHKNDLQPVHVLKPVQVLEKKKSSLNQQQQKSLKTKRKTSGEEIEHIENIEKGIKLSKNNEPEVTPKPQKESESTPKPQKDAQK